MFWTAKVSINVSIGPKLEESSEFSALDNKIKYYLLHFVAFFHVASLSSTGVENKKVGVDNKKVGVDNEKALELTNSTIFHRGTQ